MKRKFMKKISLLLVGMMMLSGCTKTQAVPEAAGTEKTAETNKEETAETNKAEGDTVQTEAATGQELEPYEIDWYLVGNGPQKDQEAVNAKINELLKDINTTVNLHVYSWGDYSEKIQTELIAGEKIDLMFTCSWAADYYTNVRNELLLDITDMLPEYAPNAVEVLKGGFLEGSQVNGRNFAVPSNKEKGAQLGLVYNKKIAEKYNFDMSSVKEQKDLLPMFEVLKEKEPGIYPYDNSSGYATGCMVMMDDPIYSMTVCFDQEKDAYIPIYESEKWLNAVDQSREIFLGGYCNPDVAVAKDSDALRKAEKVFCWFETVLPGKAGDLSTNYGCEMGVVEISEPFTRTYDMIGAMMGIPKTCKNPERVLIFLDRLYTDEQLINTINYGLEDVHYVKTGDKTIDFAPGTDGGKNLGYTVPTFEIGDTFKSWLYESQDQNKWVDYEKFNSKAVQLKNFGFVINQDTIKNEITGLTNVSNQYNAAIASGAVDPKEALPEYIKKLQSAGIDKVVEELNKQYNEWKAS